ncbi:hypothetical protein BOX15_Mlig002075g4, partial [Macrostomum lignano]
SIMETNSDANGENYQNQQAAPVYAPRQYQIDIASEGIKRNIIVKLDTGSGKTFISVMLIRYYLANSRIELDKGGQRCVFLVKNVPLVRQQAAEIRRCLFTAQDSKDVGEFIGDMGGEMIDLWAGDKWRQMFEQHRVLVMTADIFKDLLNHAKARPHWVSLLVLDECHHLDKGDAYAAICQRLLEMSQKGWDRTGMRLVGLTACLFNGNIRRNKLQERLDELQRKMLDARIVTSTHQEAEGFRLRCSEETLLYKPLYSTEEEKSETISDPIYLLLCRSLADAKQRLDNGRANSGRSSRGRSSAPGSGSSESPFRRCHRALSDSLSSLKELGHFCCFRVMQMYVKELSDVIQGASGPLKPEEQDALKETQQILLDASEQYKLKALSAQTPEDLCSEKCLKLMDSLIKHHKELPDGEAFRAVVFTQERVIAMAVKEFMCEMTGYKSDLSFLRPEFVTGHGLSSEQSNQVAMSLSQQDRVLKQFRTGEVNTLIATRVIEEGMNVRQCNLVVKFNFPPEFRSYVQSKGRARAVKSRYVMLVNEDEENDCKSKLVYYQWLDEAVQRSLLKMRAAFDAMSDEDSEPDESGATASTADASEGAAPLDLSVRSDHPAYYEVASTGAKVGLKTAVSLINRYTTRLASMGCTRPPSPYFDTALNPTSGRYRCRLFLPRPCPIVQPVQCRGDRLSADDARRSAALEAVRLLHKTGELDDHLLPSEREARCAVEELRSYEPGQGTRGRHAWLPKPVARASSSSAAIGHQIAFDSGSDSHTSTAAPLFYCHRLDVKLPGLHLPPCDWQPALLTCGAPLPDSLAFPLFLGCEPAEFRPGPGQALRLTEGQLAQLVAAQAPLTRLMLRWHEPGQMKGLRFYWPPSGGGPKEAESEHPDGAVEPICQLIAVVRGDLDNQPNGSIDWDLLSHLTSPDPLIGPAIVEVAANRDVLKPGVLVQRLQDRGTKSWHYVTSIRPNGLVEFSRTPHLDALVYNPNAAKGRMVRLLSRQNKTSVDRVSRLLAMPGIQVRLWCQLRAMPAIVYRINQLLLGCELMSLLQSAPLSTGCAVDSNPRLIYSGCSLAADQQLSVEQRALMKFDVMEWIVANGFRSPDSGSGLTLTGCLQAVTLTHANDFHSMELLETLGDARLKFTVSTRLFHDSDHTVSEGRLTRLRMREIRNAFLHCAAKEKRLHRFVFAQDANKPENYQPPCARPDADPTADASSANRRWCCNLADKSVADVAEALTGLILSACGGDAADAFLRWLGVPSASLPTPAEPAATTLLLPGEIGVESPDFVKFWGMADLDQLEVKLGYKFRRREFLLSAVTHSTFTWNHVTDCYQRLEFLGDAVIDYLVTHYAVCDCMDTGSPGAVTDLRMSLTNNNLFAAVAVSHGLESHLLSMDEPLQDLIMEYRESAAQFDGPDRFRRLSDQFVADAGADAARVVRLSAVKALGDLVESLVGAVFADSGWSLSAAWSLIRRLMSEPMRDFLAEPPRNPVRQLHETAASMGLAVKFEMLQSMSSSTESQLTPDVAAAADALAATRMRLRVGSGFVYEEAERNKRLCRVALARRFLTDPAVCSSAGGGVVGGSKRKSPPSVSESEGDGEGEVEVETAAVNNVADVVVGVSCTTQPAVLI